MRNNLFFGVVLITFGILFLLDNLGMADFGEIIHDYWPLLIIVWGLSILLRRRSLPAPSSVPADLVTDKESYSESTVFGSLYSSISSKSFKGGSISTIFGDCHVDLSKAAIAEGDHNFRVHGVFGRTNIILPPDCAVSVTASSLLGGLSILGQQKNGVATDLTIASPNYPTSSNRLNINVSKIFGEVRIG